MKRHNQIVLRFLSRTYPLPILPSSSCDVALLDIKENRDICIRIEQHFLTVTCKYTVQRLSFGFTCFRRLVFDVDALHVP